MSGLGNVAGNKSASSIPMADSSLRATPKIHVLLVDHEPEAFFNTATMLELCGYRVTRVDVASKAMAIISRSKKIFDLVMANSNSPDNQSHKLLELAAAKSIPIVLLSFKYDVSTTMRAIENGALLYLQKPVQMEMLKYLWQLVMSLERMRHTAKDRQRELLFAPSMNNNCNNKDTNGQDVELTKMPIDAVVDVKNNGLGFGATFGVNANVNNGLGLGAPYGDTSYVNNNKLQDEADFAVTANVNNGLGLGAAFGVTTNVSNNGLKLGTVFRDNAYVKNNGLEFRDVIGGTSSYANNNSLEVGGTYVNNRPGFGAVEGFSGLELGAAVRGSSNSGNVHNGLGLEGCNNINSGLVEGEVNNNGLEFSVVRAVNNGLQFGAAGGNYTANNGPGFGTVEGFNGLELGAAVRGSSSNVHNGLGLGGCNNINSGLVGGEVNNNGLSMAAKNNKRKEIIEVSSNDNSDDEDYYAVTNGNDNGKRNVIEWTDWLHARFVYAVQKLGPGRCFPKEIKELMNVPGLTRMQVASYLQRCRNQSLRLPEEQKNQFGSMPKFSRVMGKTNHPSEPDRVQNVIIAGSSSGPTNSAVANGGGVGHNYGPHVVPPLIIPDMNIMTNGAQEGAGIHHQVPSNPNYIDPDDDFFDFPSIQSLLPDISNPVPQVNQNANNLENQLGGSNPNTGRPSG